MFVVDLLGVESEKSLMLNHSIDSEWAIFVKSYEVCK